MQKLEAKELPREDVGMLLPLGMETKVVFRTNLRNLIDMAHQRMCTRAYWEYRQLMGDMVKALAEYSEEWKYLTETYFVPKCEVTGFCTEAKCCGRKPKKA
jgi:thymidylate synthase (FAD)